MHGCWEAGEFSLLLSSEVPLPNLFVVAGREDMFAVSGQCQRVNSGFIGDDYAFNSTRPLSDGFVG